MNAYSIPTLTDFINLISSDQNKKITYIQVSNLNNSSIGKTTLVQNPGNQVTFDIKDLPNGYYGGLVELDSGELVSIKFQKL